ncbi:ABC transporter substrate-binding protein [Thermodesulfobacteriota bacterium]
MKRGLLLLLAGLMIFAFTGLGLADEYQGVTKDTVTVGSILDMSGPIVHPLAQMNYGQLTYTQKAYDEGLFKRKIKIVAEDGQYNPAKHLAAGKLLLDRDKVLCFINSVGTSPSLALYQLLKARKVPLLTHGSQSKRLAEPFKRYIFVNFPSYYDQARIAVDYILGQNPKAKIAITCQDDDMGHEGKDGFLAQLKKHGVKPAGVVTFQRGAKDFSAPVLKLKSLNPDYVILHTISTYGAAIVKEAHKLAWKTKWVAISGVIDDHFGKLAGQKSFDFLGDVYGLMSSFPETTNDPVAVQFRKDLKKYQPKAAVDPRSFWGYGFGMILVEALKRAEAKNDLTREGMVRAMESFKNFQTGVFPPLTYSSTSHAGPDTCMLVKIQNLKWVPMTGDWIKAK